LKNDNKKKSQTLLASTNPIPTYISITSFMYVFTLNALKIGLHGRYCCGRYDEKKEKRFV
jgi:hypothetical protein